MSVTEAIAARRSVRSFAVSPVSLAQAAQLLWDEWKDTMESDEDDL